MPVTATWTASNSTAAARSVLYHSQNFNGDPVIKIGATVSYKSGFSYRATSTSTATPVTGTSLTTSYVIVDGATALVMTGVAAAIAALTF